MSETFTLTSWDAVLGTYPHLSEAIEAARQQANESWIDVAIWMQEELRAVVLAGGLVQLMQPEAWALPEGLDLDELGPVTWPSMLD